MSSSNQARTTPADRQAFATDGVVKIAGAVGERWIAPLLELADRELKSPGEWVSDLNPGATNNRLFTTRYLWPTETVVQEFVRESGIAALVGQLLESSTTRLYFDHTLVKEPNTSAPTPWHQDIPYWPFLGHQIASAWVALTPATVAESSLEFIRGSHRWDVYYAPESFDSSSNAWTDEFEGEPVPDIEASRDEYDIIGFDVEPGDAIVFSSWILHGAPGNAGPNRRVAFSTRWLGDDARWSPHPGSDPTVTVDDVNIRPGEYPADEHHFPLLWTSSEAER